MRWERNNLRFRLKGDFAGLEDAGDLQHALVKLLCMYLTVFT